MAPPALEQGQGEREVELGRGRKWADRARKDQPGKARLDRVESHLAERHEWTEFCKNKRAHQEKQEEP